MQRSPLAAVMPAILALTALATAKTAAAEDGICDQRDGVASKVTAVAKGLGVCLYAEGDLNGDGIADVAAVLAKVPKGVSDADLIKIPASLRVYFKSKSGALEQATQADEAVCLRCGGARGDVIPFTIAIEKGVLLLEYTGGSRWSGATTTKWRYQKGDFYLIGLMDGTIDSAARVGDELGHEVDVNVSTLKMIETIDVVTALTADGGVKSRTETKTCKAPAELKTETLKSYALDKVKRPSCAGKPKK